LAKKFQHFFNAIEDGIPCIGLDLVASGLMHDESSKSHTINQFFTISKDSAHDANGIVNNNDVDMTEKEPKKKKNMLFFAKQTTPTITPKPPPPVGSPSTSAVSFEEMKTEEMKTEEMKEATDDVAELFALLEESEKTMAEESETWVCDKCKKIILLSEVDEHTDYHFALEISQQDRIPPSTATISVSTSSSSSTTAKKRKPNKKRNSGNDDKKQKLSTYFQPHSS
jgi:DNA polymerase eta